PHAPPPHPASERVPVSSTARLSTHRTGEFAVLGSARDAYFDIPGLSWPRRDRGMRAPACALAVA
ncbi:hypothetical protein GGG16DRAFT_68396, partial [Schizophyllum commune]